MHNYLRSDESSISIDNDDKDDSKTNPTIVALMSNAATLTSTLTKLT
jgi:hypothetical protein